MITAVNLIKVLSRLFTTHLYALFCVSKPNSKTPQSSAIVDYKEL